MYVDQFVRMSNRFVQMLTSPAIIMALPHIGASSTEVRKPCMFEDAELHVRTKTHNHILMLPLKENKYLIFSNSFLRY